VLFSRLWRTRPGESWPPPPPPPQSSHARTCVRCRPSLAAGTDAYLPACHALPETAAQPLMAASAPRALSSLTDGRAEPQRPVRLLPTARVPACLPGGAHACPFCRHAGTNGSAVALNGAMRCKGPFDDSVYRCKWKEEEEEEEKKRGKESS
jgi:hypothetical protein